ncbi:MAG: helix-turn-helix domain-containing protein [Pseudobdellovibrio sp.]|nr:helix-turn-helix domain-containing protein [Pseudobdellovibrio sp.]
MDKKLLNVKEVSILLNVTTGRVYNLVHRKRIPHLKLNSSLRFDPEKIVTWLGQKEVENSGDKNGLC